MLTEPVNQVIKSTMRWIAHIIFSELDTTPKKQWPHTLATLQQKFGIPLQLVTSTSQAITHKMRQDLRIYQVAFQMPKTNKSITTLYFPTSDPDKLLVIGPIQYVMLSNLFRVEQRYYFIILTMAAILIVIYLTWLFSRNIRNIYKITQRYSSGDFSQPNKISRFSILQGVYENVVSMGNNLKRLIQSQKNMTRFVAHEVRTPLSTMQYALDSLKKEQNLSESVHQKLNSIQEDIEDINHLISYFLLYYKSTAHELKLNYQPLDMAHWFNGIVKRYEHSTINITLQVPTHNGCLVKFDPNLLKHVVDNLITNALKFASKDILVSLSMNKATVEIHVEDDGPGISSLEAKTIFEPFTTMNMEQDTSKHIGLGLTIAKSIVELHHGSITVSQSNKLGGAEFVVLLPK